MPALFLFDLLLVAAILGTALLSLASRDLFRAVVLFIAFGLFMTLAWVRLRAPDVALAEAAIGAGLTGALLLNALRVMGETDPVPTGGRRLKTIVLLVAGLAAAAMAWRMTAIVLPLTGGLGGAVRERLQESGATNEVTAVLLNFRGFDTLLEVAVLLIAVIGIMSLRAAWALPDIPALPRDPVLAAFARLLVPAATLAGAYLLWAGTHAPGGAFQAGAVLGAAGLILHLAGYSLPEALRGAALRSLYLAGFLIFLAAGGGVMLGAGRFLEYPEGRAGALIMAVETGLTLSIGAVLAGLFVLSAPGNGPPRAGREGGTP